MSDEYSRGYAAGLRELDHGLSFAEVERLQGEAARLREALERARNSMEDALSVGEARYKDFDIQLCPWADLHSGVEEVNNLLALSSHTEDTHVELAKRTVENWPDWKRRVYEPEIEIQKVRELWDELMVNHNFGGMNALEKSFIALGITIPGITDGGEEQ